MNTPVRERPAFESAHGATPAEKAENFERIQAVATLARRLATNDYALHLDACAAASTQQDREAAVERLKEAEKAARLADSAYQSLIASESDFRRSTVSMVSGDEKAALLAAVSSGQHLEIVSDKLDRFGDYAPRSRFFARAIELVVQADRFAGRVEDTAVRTVECVSRGFKAFAARVRSFGATVKEVPELIAHNAKAAGTSTAAAAADVYSGFTGRMKAAFGRVQERAEGALRSARTSALDILDDAQERAERAAAGVGRAAATAQLHASATVGLAGGLLSRVGAAVREGYTDALQEAAQRSARRAPRP